MPDMMIARRKEDWQFQRKVGGTSEITSSSSGVYDSIDGGDEMESRRWYQWWYLVKIQWWCWNVIPLNDQLLIAGVGGVNALLAANINAECQMETRRKCEQTGMNVNYET